MQPIGEKLNIKYLLFSGAIPIIIAFYFISVPIDISNDGIQYLVGAKHIKNGKGYSTSILYFDEHYNSGKMPAPQTVWPPGYPLSIALFSYLGVTEEQSSRCISTLSFLVLIPVLYYISFYLTYSNRMALFSCTWVSSITYFWDFSVMSNSEMLFILLSASVYLFLISNISNSIRLSMSSLFAGAAFAVRYPGVFLIASVIIFTVLETILLEDNIKNRIKNIVFGIVPGITIFLAIITRNYLLSGDLKGGNAKVVTKSLLGTLKITLISVLELFGGIKNSFHAGKIENPIYVTIVSLLLLLAFVYTICAIILNVRHFSMKEQGHRNIMYVSVYTMMYIIGIIYISTNTMATIGPRFYLPIVPFIIMLVTYTISAKIDNFTDNSINSKHLVLKKFTAYAIILCVTIITLVQIVTYITHDKFYNNSIKYNKNVASWIKSHSVGNEVVVVIGDGQKIAYYSGIPTAVIPHEEFSGIDWNESRMRELSIRYKIKKIVLLKEIGPDGYSGFIKTLFKGITPSWMHTLQDTSDMIVYAVMHPETYTLSSKAVSAH